MEPNTVALCLQQWNVTAFVRLSRVLNCILL